MKAAVPGAGRISQALKAMSGVRPRTARVRNPTGAGSEAFRLLALNSRILLPEGSRPAVVIMSAFSGDGRSFVAEQLAGALVDECPVMLVEQVGETMTLTDRLSAHRNGSDASVPSGLSNSLLSTDNPGIFLHPTPPVPTGLSIAVDQAAEAGYFTVVDSPPAASSSTAFLLAREVGQVIYIVRQRAQDVDLHRQIREQLDRLGVNILGLVVNEA